MAQEKGENLWNSRKFVVSLPQNKNANEREQTISTAGEPVAATAMATEYALPEDVDYANIVDGTLQVTSDIEDEIAEVERGEVISMGEFKTMFAKWLD